MLGFPSLWKQERNSYSQSNVEGCTGCLRTVNSDLGVVCKLHCTAVLASSAFLQNALRLE